MIAEIRNGNNVKRFHTTPRIQEETNGHHSANVAAILLRIEPNCSRQLLISALMHDVPEAYTGDVPAPFKWENPHIKSGLDKGEQDYTLRHHIPNPELNIEERQLLKLADMLDLVFSSLEELGRGNRYAEQLVANGENYLKNGPNWAKYGMVIIQMMREVREQWQLTTSK